MMETLEQGIQSDHAGDELDRQVEALMTSGATPNRVLKTQPT
jgi:hypothetical protein